MDDYVEFSPNWKENAALFDQEDTRFYRVKRQQCVSYDLHYFINVDKKIDVLINEDNGLEPTSPFTLYQILFGLKQSGAGVILYSMWPQGNYISQLQKVGMRPYTDKPDKRYLGGWTEEESPASDPHLLEWVLKDYNPVNWRIYNDSPNAQKLIISMKINKLKLEAMGSRKTPIREVYHYKDLNWG